MCEHGDKEVPELLTESMKLEDEDTLTLVDSAKLTRKPDSFESPVIFKRKRMTL